MNKKVLILSGSPRKGGNSDILRDEFAREENTPRALRREYYAESITPRALRRKGLFQIKYL